MPRRIDAVTASPDFRLKLGRRIYDARRAAGLTQAELAKLLGASTTWVTNIEAGAYSIDLQVMARMSEALDRPLDWFMAFDGDVPSRYRMPITRADWEVAYPNEPARANAHASIDEVFKKGERARVH